MASHPQTIDLPARAAAIGTRTFPRFAWMQNHRWINTALIRGGFTLLAALCDFGAICVAVAAVHLLNLCFAQAANPVQTDVSFTLVVMVFFLAMNIMRGEYEFGHYLTYKERLQQAFLPWNIVFLCAVALALWTPVANGLSAFQAFVFYGFGLISIMIARMSVVTFVRARAEAGSIATRRVLLIGYEDEIAQFSERYEPWRFGMQIAAASVLRGEDHLKDDLKLASAHARILRPDDIFILLPWSHKQTIDQCIDAFMRIPAAIHLGPENVLDRFADARVSKIGPVASLNLVHRPLSTWQVFFKRALDIVAASLALFVLSPFLLAVALIIKSDSPGPIIFKQRRYGFNQEPFQIFKFRSMTTLEDGAKVQQATENDVRFTSIGKFIRRFNIDELPQLLNVLRGEMSLVGPRPHALVHDQQFERSIGLYAKRHNVKPGITGWAQVSGFRGAITTDDKIQQRIAHDLYYIDNWSLLFDLQILWLTILSKKAYRNAY